MKKIVIMKVGSTFSELVARRGDFEDWIVAGMGAEREQVRVVDVSAGEELPGHGEVAGVVITGSHSMVTQHLDWSEYAAGWLRGAAARHLPALGICYGHQLLAYALAGRVGDNPHGREYGTVLVHLQSAATEDLLFQGLPEAITAHVCHRQSALTLPAEARLLASSALEPHQAFVIGDRIWGVQFHSEFDAEVVAEYVRRDRELLAEEGKDPDRILEGVAETPFAGRLLAKFHDLVKAFNGAAG